MEDQILARFARGDNFVVRLVFEPWNEQRPYLVEVASGLTLSETRHSIREEAVANFQGLVRGELNSI